MPDLTTRIAGLDLRTPVLLASGTVGYGPEYEGLIDFGSVGALVMKTVTPEPRTGNPPPRLVETPCGMLNAIGLENVGLERFLDEKLPEASELPVPLVASVAGTSTGEFASLAGAIGERSEVSAVELNISCPNVEREMKPVWADPGAVAEIVSASKRSTGSPVIVKLSPNTARVVEVAEAAEAAGADALTVANTMPGMRIDLGRMRPALGNETGGLSGRALFPINLALVWKVAENVSVPVIGSGGVFSAETALEFIAAGAAAVQVGTAVFSDPRAPETICSGLREYLETNGLDSIGELVGAAREERIVCRTTA